MSERARALAEQFEQANNDVIAAVERCSDEQWRAACKDEGWSVGVTTHHLAGGHQGISGIVGLIANRQPLPPMTMEMIDQGNAQHAQEHANCTKEETLALLRENGAAAANLVRGLSDEQLDRSAPLLGGPPVTAAQAIENILIGHPRQHLASIKGATGG